MCKKTLLARRVWRGIKVVGKAAWIPIGTLAAIVAAGAAVWLLVAQERRWYVEDRPQVVVTGTTIMATPDPATATLAVYLKKDGREDATRVQVTPTTVDLTESNPKVLLLLD